MKLLHPPLVVVEKEDEEFIFFSTTDEILSDRHDLLWGNAYDGWDADGQFFSLVRREVPRRWCRRLFSIDSTVLSLEGVRTDYRVRDLGQLLAAGLKQCARSFSRATGGAAIPPGDADRPWPAVSEGTVSPIRYAPDCCDEMVVGNNGEREAWQTD